MMTGVGVILGTAAYMSPEQARGKVVDKRADIWAFGCVLFEMLTGQRTFEGELISDVLASVLKTDPNWQALPAGTPAALRRLVGRCLEKDPRRRLQAIGEARVQIEDLLTGAPEPITGPAASLSAPLWPRLALVGVAAACDRRRGRRHGLVARAAGGAARHTHEHRGHWPGRAHDQRP